MRKIFVWTVIAIAALTAPSAAQERPSEAQQAQDQPLREAMLGASGEDCGADDSGRTCALYKTPAAKERLRKATQAWEATPTGKWEAATAKSQARIYPEGAPGKDWTKDYVTYDHKIPWQIRDRALVCPNYFKIKDAQAAVRAKDDAWLAQTGCMGTPTNARVELIDAQRLQYETAIWHGRIYGGVPEQDYYFSEFDVLTFATPSGGSDTPSLFASVNEVKAWLKKNGWEGQRWLSGQTRWSDDIPYRITPNGKKFNLWLGPAPYYALKNFCGDFPTKCTVTGYLPR